MTFISDVKTICGFAMLSPDWRVYFTRRHADSDWKRYALRLGPLYLSWSVARA